MANRYAVASGNWSNPAIWDGGTLPTSSDVVRPNSFTVDVDISVTILEIRNNALAPSVAGGTFRPNNTVIINSTNGIYSGSNISPITFNLSTGNSATIIGNSISSGNLFPPINVTGTGTLTYIGNLFPASNSAGIFISASAGGCVLNVTGDGAAAAGSGNVINVGATCTINYTGAVTGGSTTNVYGIACGVTGTTVNIIGVVTGGALGAAGIFGSVCIVSVTGIIQASGGAHGVEVTGTTGAVILMGTAINNIGLSAIYSRRLFIGASPSVIQFKNNDLTTDRFMYTADVSPGMPSQANVKDGVVYGQSSELTGTLEVPPASSVAVGVPVDGTVGTAMISITDMGALLSSYNV
jgi:hypothetical protein